VLCHAPFLAKFLVCLATRIVAFLMKIADFALMGPADDLLLWPSYLLPHPWCENTVSHHGVKVAASFKVTKHKIENCFSNFQSHCLSNS
jgi:hypothetical protein